MYIREIGIQWIIFSNKKRILKEKNNFWFINHFPDITMLTNTLNNKN
jgi:hypothetical protein